MALGRPSVCPSCCRKVRAGVSVSGKVGAPCDKKRLGKVMTNPPAEGRQCRCIVSVGMLTEGWDCNTVTHVVGLRPFQSQLLCEQVVGRALRRRFYESEARMTGSRGGGQGVRRAVRGGAVQGDRATPKPRPPQRRIYAVPQKAQFAITVPRVLGYSIGVRNRIAVPDWPAVRAWRWIRWTCRRNLELAAMLNQGKPSALSRAAAAARSGRVPRRASEQQFCFQMAADLTRQCGEQTCEAPPHVLFPQLLAIVQRYMRKGESITAGRPASMRFWRHIMAGSSSAARGHPARH